MKKLYIIIIILAVFVLLATVVKSSFLLFFFYIVAAFMFASRRDNIGWGIITAALCCAFTLVGGFLVPPELKNITFGIFLGLYALSAIPKYLAVGKHKLDHKKEIKGMEKEIAEIEKALEADLRILNSMLPSLEAEFHAKQNELIAKSNESIDREMLPLLTNLPPLYWWQITPQKLRAFEDKQDEGYKSNTNVLWETRWVNRSKGKEFPDAGYEYSPLMEVSDSSAEYKQAYDEIKDVCFDDYTEAGVFDFISRGVSTSTEAETFYYEDFALSDYKRAKYESKWKGLGYGMDIARQKGEISAEQYAFLTSTYAFASPGVYEKLDEKVEKEGVKYNPVKTSTNMWTGQLLLANDDKGEGVMIIDYRSRIPHLFKNIDALADVNVTRVCGDPIHRDPMIMAKFHKVCVNCR